MPVKWSDLSLPFIFNAVLVIIFSDSWEKGNFL